MKQPVVFISGQIDMSPEEFGKLYKPQIDYAIQNNANFLLGDLNGVSALAQIYLAKILPKDQHKRVKIFFKGNTPNNYISSEFSKFGGFVSDEEAAVAMTLCSTEDLVIIESGRHNSLPAKNILRRYTKNFDYFKYSNAKNRNYDFWNMLLKQDNKK